MGEKKGSGPILVTGGCGSVGSAVVEYLSSRIQSPEILIYDNDERRLFEQRRASAHDGADVSYRLGDVRDAERLSEVVREVCHIVHAAALKQVPQCERQPYESVKTNVEGTRNVIKAARRHDVESVLTVSTDKATNPSSVMGASKLLAERVTLMADKRTQTGGPSFSSVRLGNVVGSSGSVVPVFLEQIRNGGPVTLTDDRMTRFVISRSDAAEFIVEHIDPETSGVTYIPELQCLRIEDLADVMTELYAYRAPGAGSVRVEETGRRPGERLHEILVSPDERHRTIRQNDEYVVYPPSADDDVCEIQSADTTLPENGLSSKDATPMTTQEIGELLRQADPVESTTPSPEDVSRAVQQDD